MSINYKFCPPRPTSTTTRIKTACLSSIPTQSAKLRDLLPLQQGLRLNGVPHDATPIIGLRDLLPLQQGLRLLCSLYELSWTPRPTSTTTRIKTLFSASFLSANMYLRDLLPLQQGLRHSNLELIWEDFGLVSETYFHYNKD